MPSARIQRQIDRLLDEADEAALRLEWTVVRDRAKAALAYDPDNADAHAYLATAERGLSASPDAAPDRPLPNPPPRGEGTTTPTSFANGRYAVKRLLGEGGKKKVYLAHDTLLDRDVAFALIKIEGLDDTGRDRIRREAQAMGRLGSHPHIVSVFDLGEEPDLTPRPPSLGGKGESSLFQAEGQPFIVTELMGGGDVEGLIDKAPEHRPPLERSLEIAIQVCRGLEFAHAHGIVHRDLKPGNVWLTENLTPGPFPTGEGETPVPSSRGGGLGRGQGAGGEGGVAKLGDFGLAVALDRSRLTQAGMMVGTVSYMPPEQAMGGEVTPRSDLYSLGAMLYEMVTGRPPFVGDESVAIITQHLNVAPVSPSWHNPQIPPALETLILRLLEKDPSKRPASAGEVREALEHIAAAALHPSLPQGERGDRPPPSPLEGEGLGMRGDNPLYRRVFVGRELEIRQLQSAFDSALSGKGALAMVVGEPGIGKTAVCEQLATYVTLRGGTTLYGHCYEEGSLSLPYLAFVEALRSYAIGRPPEALRQELGTAASDLARIVSEVRERLSVEPRPPGDPEEDRWRLLQAVSGFLRNASAVQPLLLVLEDLHWADQGTLDLLQHLARNLQGARLLVIGTYRDVEVDRSHPLSATLAELRRGAEFGRVLLRGLGTPEVQRMLVAITSNEVPGSLAESIHRQTEGNPLFVQEVVRYLVEEGHLGRGGPNPRPLPLGGRGEETSPAAAMSIPEGLRDVIGRRLSRLSPNCNRVLAVAAVIGRDFGLETLHAVVELDEEQVVSSLEEALHIGVLEEQSRPGSIRYRFAHAFFRQTLYEELIAPRRLRLHQQVAAALERQYAVRLEEHAAELAEHFAQSTGRRDLRKAVRYGELAAERAVSVYAYGEAARHLEQALAVQEVLDPDDAAKRCDLLLELGDTLVSLGESTRAAEAVAPEALRLAASLDDHARASHACRVVGRTVGGNNAWWRSPEANKWSQLSDRYADEGTVDRVYADVFLSNEAQGMGDTARALSQVRKAVLLARRLDDPVALVTSASALLFGASQRPEEHEELLDLSEEVSRRPLDAIGSTQLAQLLRNLGWVYLTWGRRQEAERHWERAKEVALRSRDAEMAFVPFQIDALVNTLDGRLERPLELEIQLRARGAEVNREGQAATLGARAARRALIYLGRAEEALPGIFESPDLFSVNGVYTAQRALCLAHSARAKEARDILDAMLHARDMSRPDGPTPASVLRALLEASVLLKHVEAVRVLGVRMAPMAGLLQTEADMCYNIGRLCGGAAALLGETEKARDYYQQAIEICEKVRFRPELALTRLELAELMLGQAGGFDTLTLSGAEGAPTKDAGTGSVGARRVSPSRAAARARAGETPAPPDVRAEAIAHLDFAIAEFREMKMQPSLERALRHKEVLKA